MAVVLGASEVEVRHVAPVVDNPLSVSLGEPDASVSRIPKRRPRVSRVPKLNHPPILAVSPRATSRARHEPCAETRGRVRRPCPVPGTGRGRLEPPSARAGFARIRRTDDGALGSLRSSAHGTDPRKSRRDLPRGTRGNDKQRSTSRTGVGRSSSAARACRQKERWTVLAYCLMTNHYHVSQDPMRVSQGMRAERQLREADERHRRSNHLFGRRFWSEQSTRRVPQDSLSLRRAEPERAERRDSRDGLGARCSDTRRTSRRLPAVDELLSAAERARSSVTRRVQSDAAVRRLCLARSCHATGRVR